MARDTTVASQRNVAALATPAGAGAAVDGGRIEQDKTLPLPGWLVKVYFIFPIVLYLPDAIFNYFVYSDGTFVPRAPLFLQIAEVTLWVFMATGVVGMAYLLSVLAPWHWGQGHRIQALFCGLGVVVATAITTWNSLAFRSTGFQAFRTDTWVWQSFPQLQGISLTMVLVAIAPPFWGLFWAIVQPTQTGRSLRQIRESHAERLLRLEQEAELKRLKAESNAKVRSAQLRGMAQTAAAAREEASQLFARKKGSAEEDPSQAGVSSESDENPDLSGDTMGRVVQLTQIKGTGGRDAAVGRSGAVFSNHAVAAIPAVHAAPTSGTLPPAAQPPLLPEPDVHRSAATAASDPMPWGGARRPGAPAGGMSSSLFSGDNDQMTGTTGPRPAVRRPGENNTLFRGISEDLLPRSEAAIQEMLRELNPNGTRKPVPRKEVIGALTRKLGVDEATAQKIWDRYRESRKTTRSGR